MKAEKKGIVIISAVIAIAVVTTIILIPLLRHNSISGYMKEDIKMLITFPSSPDAVRSAARKTPLPALRKV